MNCDWATNEHVTKGEIFHENVNVSSLIKIGTAYKCQSLRCYNEKYEINGVIDVLELKPSKNGVEFLGIDGKFEAEIVEYKNSSPKDGARYNLDDALQVYGQKLCVDEMFGTNCKTSFFFNDTKRRVKFEIDEIIVAKFNEVLAEIKRCTNLHIIPPIDSKQYCNGCSINNLCMPTRRKKSNTFKEMVEQINETIE